MINLIFKSDKSTYICDAMLRESGDIYNFIKLPDEFSNKFKLNENDIYLVDINLIDSEYKIDIIKEVNIMVENNQLILNTLSHENILILFNKIYNQYLELPIP